MGLRDYLGSVFLPWLGFSEGRRYDDPERTLAAAVRRAARELLWVEVGPLSGPHMRFLSPSRGLELDVELRRDGDQAWVLVRSRVRNPMLLVDMFSARAVAQLYRRIEEVARKSALPPDTRIHAGPVTRAFELEGAVPHAEVREAVHPAFPRRLPIAAALGGALLGLVTLLWLPLGAALLVALVASLALALVWSLTLLVCKSPLFAKRQERTLRVLRSGDGLEPKLTAVVDYPVGGELEDPKLDAAPVRFAGVAAIAREAAAFYRQDALRVWALAALAMLPFLALESLATSVIAWVWPSQLGPVVGMAAAHVLSLCLYLPLLTGIVIALRDGDRFAAPAQRVDGFAARVGLGDCLARVALRLPRYLWAQLRVAAVAIAVTLLAVTCGLLLVATASPPLALLGALVVMANLVFQIWWAVVHCLTGPISFLSDEPAVLARSRALTRGFRLWVWSVLMLAGLAIAGLAFAGSWTMHVIVQHVPPFTWLPGWLAVVGMQLVLSILHTIPALLAVRLYHNARVLHEGLDVRSGNGRAPEHVAPLPIEDGFWSRLRRMTPRAAIGAILAFATLNTALVGVLGGHRAAAAFAPGAGAGAAAVASLSDVEIRDLARRLVYADYGEGFVIQLRLAAAGRRAVPALRSELARVRAQLRNEQRLGSMAAVYGVDRSLDRFSALTRARLQLEGALSKIGTTGSR